MPWRARDFVHCWLRRRASRPQLKRDPLGGCHDCIGCGEGARSEANVATGRVTYLMVALLLLAEGCVTHLHRFDRLTPLKADAEVLVWTWPYEYRWRAVVIGPDSVSGVPYDQQVACNPNCRRSVPRDAVDSMAVVSHGVTLMDVGGVAFTIVFIVVALGGIYGN